MEYEISLEEQIAALQAQIDYLKNGGMSVSPAKRMQDIRHEYREKYFGSFEQMREGETEYGPRKKAYADYSTIMDIVAKASGLIFKYSNGKSVTQANIVSLMSTAEDERKYREICESVCRSLREMIDQYEQRKKGGELDADKDIQA